MSEDVVSLNRRHQRLAYSALCIFQVSLASFGVPRKVHILKRRGLTL